MDSIRGKYHQFFPMHQIPQPPEAPRLYGFDYLRTFGVVLVLLQHQLSILGLESLTSLGEVNIGQCGVAIFLAVSGILAMHGNRSPANWLTTRMGKIYPAYWIATAFGFMVTAASGHKTFGVLQVISQFAGTGLFTHRDQLVNVVTWFVSLLLLLYFLVFLARLTKQPYPATLLAGLIAGLLVLLDIEPLLSAHALAFFSALLLFPNGKPRPRIFLAVVLAFLILAIPHRTFIYPALSLLLTVAVLPLPPAPGIISLAARYSYEFYLCHAIFLVGSQKLIGRIPLVSIPLGIVASLVGTVLLSKAAQKLVTLFNNLRSSSIENNRITAGNVGGKKRIY